MDDLRAVLDAANSTSTVLFGGTDSGLLATLFAAMHPERTRALILFNSFARLCRDRDYPEGMPPNVADLVLRGVEQAWRTESTEALDVAFPPDPTDPVGQEWFRHYLRLAASPSAAVAMQRLVLQADLRQLLPSIQVPTLIIHRRDNALYRVGHGRYLAENIPNARYVELEGSDQTYYRNGDDLLDELREFITGVRASPAPERVLATVLFTDIVGSTRSATQVGDQRWRLLLDQHDTVARRQIQRFRGRSIKSTGDGTLATFDGPGRAIQCAIAIGESVEAIGLRVRSGLHAGELEIRGDNIGGIAVHIAARVAALAETGETLVSRTVADLVAGAGIDFEDRGEHDLKGVPGTWKLYGVRA